MKAAALAITLVAIAVLMQPAPSVADDFKIQCSANETIKHNAGACDECRCAFKGRPKVCTMQLVVKGCFCDDNHCRTRDGNRCVSMSDCY
uniref:TIL domain containing protein n=1 Tax=Rhipicephalus zambeziensis TaxID=60191 RepID=A0A224YFJ8_9ACAR